MINNIMESFKQIKDIKIKPFIEDVVTFVSIIGILYMILGAYYYVSLSF